MAFTYDLTTPRGKVRLGLTDTREDSAWFTDAEIDHFLDVGGDVNGGIVKGARILLMDRARRTSRWANDEGSYDDTAQVAALKEIITQHGGAGDNLPSVTVTFPALLPSDAGHDESNP